MQMDRGVESEAEPPEPLGDLGPCGVWASLEAEGQGTGWAGVVLTVRN